MVWSFLNFFIFLFLLWRLAKKPAAQAAEQKSEEYKKLLQESMDAYARAEKRLHSLKKRFATLEQEFVRIKHQAKQTADLEAEKLKKEAERVSEYLASEAQRVSRVEQEKAKNLLQKELWEQTRLGVVEKLQSEMTAAEQKQVLSNSIQALGALKN